MKKKMTGRERNSKNQALVQIMPCDLKFMHSDIVLS